jgi:Protein of unknown function (DUF2716)
VGPDRNLYRRLSGRVRRWSRDVAALVLGTLQDCTEWWETVVFHDWAHPSALFRPHKVDEPEEVPGWDIGGLFPNGDYTIFVGRDDAFGILGHPLEHTLCVFGEPAVRAFAARNRGPLGCPSPGPTHQADPEPGLPGWAYMLAMSRSTRSS